MKPWLIIGMVVGLSVTAKAASPELPAQSVSGGGLVQGCVMELLTSYHDSLKTPSSQTPKYPYLGVLGELLCEKYLELVGQREEGLGRIESSGKMSGSVGALEKDVNAAELAWTEIQLRHVEQQATILRNATKAMPFNEATFWDSWLSEDREFSRVSEPILKLTNQLTGKVIDALAEKRGQVEKALSEMERKLLEQDRKRLERILHQGQL